jgi:hypothetical protein
MLENFDSKNAQGTLGTDKSPGAQEQRAPKHKANPGLVEEFVDKIRASRDLQRRSVIDTGQLLVEAKSQLTGADFRSVVKKAGLQSMPTAENYMRVAQAPHLQNPEFRSFLPVGVGALIDIAAWTEEAIRDCIAAGVMRPDVERATLRHWIVAYSNPRRSEAPENSTQYTPVWIIKADPERWTREHDERLKKCLEVEFPDRIIDLDLPRDGSRGKVKHIRRWKIYQKLKEQAAVVETLPMKDFLLMPLRERARKEQQFDLWNLSFGERQALSPVELQRLALQRLQWSTRQFHQRVGQRKWKERKPVDCAQNVSWSR